MCALVTGVQTCALPIYIPPHNGATNTRLTVHMPLVIPPDCALRVGDETRVWEPGKLLMFDDTIRHEAWNYSDRLRVVLIFDVWHPMLTELARELVSQTVPIARASCRARVCQYV